MQTDLYSGALFVQVCLGWNLYLSTGLMLAVTALYTIAGKLRGGRAWRMQRPALCRARHASVPLLASGSSAETPLSSLARDPLSSTAGLLDAACPPAPAAFTHVSWPVDEVTRPAWVKAARAGF